MMCALVALTACGTGVKQSVRTPVEMGERIELKTPDPKMGLTINEALAARSSSRDFSPEMLSLEELSGVLWAAAGVNREDGHLTAPSAMALYPIRVYAFLPEGVYRYDSKANVLNRVIEGDRRELTAMQDFAYTDCLLGVANKILPEAPPEPIPDLDKLCPPPRIMGY